MKKLRKLIEEAEKKKIAIGHFNVGNLEQFKAVTHAARKLDVPVIIGVSEGEREYLGIHHFRDLIASYNTEHGRPHGFWIYANADHTHSLEKVREAARVGFHSILFDGGRLPFEENIRLTKQAVILAKSVNHEVLIEGELGFIGGSSEVFKELPKGAAIMPEDLTTPEQALRFVKETGVDLLAPAVGNIHGILAKAKPLIDVDDRLINADNNISINQQNQHESALNNIAGNPPLDIQRIRDIKNTVKIPLVLHGGSGIVDEDFVAAIDAGISIVHISTELRVAWRKALENSLKKHADEVAPYKVMPEVIEEMEKVVEQRLRLFNKI